MIHHYFPHTQQDIDEMLERIGIGSLEELYSDVPESLRLKQPYNLPPAQSEKEIRDFFDMLGAYNRRLTCFAGAGHYEHYAPAVIGSLIARSEFLTAYTPYQPEISQGTLQYIFEYQTMMSRLTGLEISNASMYDGATATAEAMLMSVAHARRRNRVLVSATLNPAVREVVDTYAHYHGVKVDTIEEKEGVTSREDFESKLATGDVAGVIVSAPNYYGIVEDYTGWADACHQAKSLFIMNSVAIDLASIRTPGEWGADIAVGDAQSLGMPLSFGGPYLGYMCATKALIRKMPGRIVGATTDDRGNRVFVLTLQAREQHIRREKATSNICSNQGLMALYATMYCSVMGAKGLREVNSKGYDAAHYLASKLEDTGRMKLKYPGQPFFNEFAVTVDFNIDALFARALELGILPGVKVDNNTLLIATTEMLTKADLDRYVELVKAL
ncbi:MAG: aminomethyl-transferring glycine dehydrogenase subunit GcvPA [Clostridiales bacterium]|nr:aminomethyl-transferring glycine dehydrogenase subunit GcvPA [Clostridiales bacterium]